MTLRAVASAPEANCENAACRKPLPGSVKFCPFCGQTNQSRTVALRPFVTRIGLVSEDSDVVSWDPSGHVAEPPPPPFGDAPQPTGDPARNGSSKSSLGKPAEPRPPHPPELDQVPLVAAGEVDPQAPVDAAIVHDGAAPGFEPAVAPPMYTASAEPYSSDHRLSKKIQPLVAVVVIAFVAWLVVSLVGPKQGGTPADIEAAPTVAQEPVPGPTAPPSQLPPPPTITDKRLAQARTCLDSGDMGCAWRGTRYVLEREPGNETALSIEAQINRHVDQQLARFDQDLAAGDLQGAEAALTDARRATNFDGSNPRLEYMSTRLEERRQAQQRSAAEGSASMSDALVSGLLSDANANLTRGNFDAAESLVNQVLRIDAANREAMQILGEIEIKKEQIKTQLRDSFR